MGKKNPKQNQPDTKGNTTTRTRPKKDAYRIKILEYLANPEHETPSRAFLAVDILGLDCPPTLYRFFSPSELADIEKEALSIRRDRYAGKLLAVDCSLLTDAAKPGADAATRKLAYQRFEGWTEKTLHEVGGTEKIGDFLQKAWERATGGTDAK